MFLVQSSCQKKKSLIFQIDVFGSIKLPILDSFFDIQICEREEEQTSRNVKKYHSLFLKPKLSTKIWLRYGWDTHNYSLYGIYWLFTGFFQTNWFRVGNFTNCFQGRRTVTYVGFLWSFCNFKDFFYSKSQVNLPGLKAHALNNSIRLNKTGRESNNTEHGLGIHIGEGRGGGCPPWDFLVHFYPSPNLLSHLTVATPGSYFWR